jgi:hypothetical protein
MIYIGTTKKTFKNLPDEKLSLSRHSWNCGWYWGFGYIGNKHLHTHFDSVFLNDCPEYEDIFEDAVFTSDEWWIIRDLFMQAYALRKAAEVYRYGGHQTTFKGLTDCIKSEELENKINADLKKVLDTLWNYIERDRSLVINASKKIKSLKKQIEDKKAKIEEHNDLIKKELIDLTEEIKREKKYLK